MGNILVEQVAAGKLPAPHISHELGVCESG